MEERRRFFSPFSSFYLFLLGSLISRGEFLALRYLMEELQVSLTCFLVCSGDVGVSWSVGVSWFSWSVDVGCLEGIDLPLFLQRATSVHSLCAESLSEAFSEGVIGAAAEADGFGAFPPFSGVNVAPDISVA